MKNIKFAHNEETVGLGRQLHTAALKSQSMIDAIPENISVECECAAIDAAAEPVYAIAEMIVRLPCETSKDRAVRARAQAWIDGYFWNLMEIAA